jgi:ketosteroid isomerase-like protein
MSAAAIIPEDAERLIRAMDEQFVENIRHGNVKRLVSEFYAADARLMPPNHPPAIGHDAIVEFFETILAGGVKDLELTTTHVEASGDLAFGTGSYTLSMRPPNGTNTTDRGKYVVVYRRQRDGQLRAIVDMFSSNNPA